MSSDGLRIRHKCLPRVSTVTELCHCAGHGCPPLPPGSQSHSTGDGGQCWGMVVSAAELSPPGRDLSKCDCMCRVRVHVRSLDYLDLVCADFSSLFTEVSVPRMDPQVIGTVFEPPTESSSTPQLGLLSFCDGCQCVARCSAFSCQSPISGHKSYLGIIRIPCSLEEQ